MSFYSTVWCISKWHVIFPCIVPGAHNSVSRCLMIETKRKNARGNCYRFRNSCLFVIQIWKHNKLIKQSIAINYIDMSSVMHDTKVYLMPVMSAATQLTFCYGLEMFITCIWVWCLFHWRLLPWSSDWFVQILNETIS